MLNESVTVSSPKGQRQRLRRASRRLETTPAPARGLHPLKQGVQSSTPCAALCWALGVCRPGPIPVSGRRDGKSAQQARSRCGDTDPFTPVLPGPSPAPPVHLSLGVQGDAKVPIPSSGSHFILRLIHGQFFTAPARKTMFSSPNAHGLLTCRPFHVFHSAWHSPPSLLPTLTAQAPVWKSLPPGSLPGLPSDWHRINT